ncbi:MAG: hypothetical protein PHI98_03920 [Eubacteriales bacterium]|nr:hypothetical protein [Eubacteriales bacterium]
MTASYANPFVDYLNSLHNGNAANQNAIGEMQISSPFFDDTQVKRPLVSFLQAKVEKGDFIILTGHAGDGKTTLLAQVLDAIGSKQQRLLPFADIDCGCQQVHYVKDFSELTKVEQDSELQSCFSRRNASILIANTGPLLSAFNRLDSNGHEADLLDLMDLPCGGYLSVEENGRAFVLNIARVDNTDFIKPYLQNLVATPHWSACAACPSAERCPIYFNRNMLIEKIDRASGFIEKAYIWLQEYDHRATIRQITAHLTYAMTGGLHCNSVASHCADSWRYRYLFSNLFFGCEGNDFREGAKQIHGIRLVTEAKFDIRPTCVDYELFNKNQYEAFYPAPLAGVFDEAFNQHRHRDTGIVQTILKRAYLFFGQNTNEVDQAQEKETFSEWFDLYLRIRNKGEKPKDSFKKSICSAINTLFVGETLGEFSDHIDLTLRRNNEQTSNVQLLSGRIAIDNIALKCEPYDTVSGQKQYHLVFCTGKMKYRISLPLLNYFCEIYHGIIITDIDPMLSNGIDSLKAQLLSNDQTTVDENEVPLVFLSGNRWVKRKLIIGEHSIDHD